MDISETRHGAVLVVAPVGRVDSTTSDGLDQALTRVVDAGDQRLVVDLAGVSYISSAGLRVLLVVAKRLKTRRGTLVLCALGDAVRQVFDLAGFLPLFQIEPTRELAVARCGATPA
ncbi:MAG: STAS domain-containing protein [Acidobacteriota bacterium]